MSDWQERITRDTSPGVRVEHSLRYRIVAPLIAASGSWADLGCGMGLAAVAALGDRRPEHAVLVDLEEELVAAAAAELGVPDTRQLAGDLTDPETLARIGEMLLSVEGERTVTCFEVVEHLTTFIPLLEWSGALAREGAATFVISVPNDGFWSIDNPYHVTAWSEGAFEELHRLLPHDRTLLRQVALTGSALVDWEATPERRDLESEVGGEGTVATHFIAAFGPRHRELRPAAVAVQTDLLEQRRWERQRESDVAVAQLVGREQSATIDQQREELRGLIAQLDDWRVYIHELERELGRPLSGVEQERSTGEHEHPAGNDSSSASEPLNPDP